MSALDPSLLPPLPFYRSRPQNCPYLEGQIEQKLFTKLPDDPPLAQLVNSTLTANGFRRSYDVVYRPLCAACNACTPVRIPVNEFHPNRSQRRILRKNSDLHFEPRKAIASQELFLLFQAYEAARHADSEMAHMNFQGFRAMIEEGAAPKALYVACRSHDPAPVAAVLTDRLADGISAVYSFFTPEKANCSLGTWLILKLVEAAALLEGQFLYLGYWVAQSRKMAYKGNFRPLEALDPSGWKRLLSERPGEL